MKQNKVRKNNNRILKFPEIINEGLFLRDYHHMIKEIANEEIKDNYKILKKQHAKIVDMAKQMLKKKMLQTTQKQPGVPIIKKMLTHQI